MTYYPCLNVHDLGRSAGGGPCSSTAVYFARDNRARLGHLCRFCWRSLPASEQDLYAERDRDDSR